MRENNNVKALKSGVWYTIANFLTKSIGFITTPIFTRLLSHEDYGLFSNYIAWLNTFTIFATLGLGTSFISARYDHEKDFDGYISSTLVLSSIVTFSWALIINIFPNFFSSLTGVEIRYINIMVVYLLMFSAIDMYQARERYYFEYKITVAISLLVTISTAALSVFLVINLENKLLGRIVGNAIPIVLIGMVLYSIIIIKGKKVSINYWKYALPICLPFIPHTLSLSLLHSIDKIMITRVCGAEENALYSVAYTCGAVITLLVTSLNTAFAPWLGEKLNEKDYGEIRKVSKYYILLFSYAACGVMLLTPEILLVMGGKSYSEAIYVMPPIAFGCVCQFLYTMYVNVEQFCKKTIGMAFASASAAVCNFILNSIYIPRYGYIAAAYTTLTSYLILLFIHMLLVKKVGLQKVYSTKIIILILGLMSGYTILVNFLYGFTTIRITILCLYILVSIYIVYIKRKDILKMVKKQ